jgi:hypothetical protein
MSIDNQDFLAQELSPERPAAWLARDAQSEVASNTGPRRHYPEWLLTRLNQGNWP